MLAEAHSWKLDRPLTSLERAVEGSELFVRHPLDEAWQGSAAPTQSVGYDVLNMEAIRTDSRRRLERPESDAGHVERKRGVKSSREVFRGTGVPVETVVRYIEHGLGDERILTSYPTLYPADIEVARQRVSA